MPFPLNNVSTQSAYVDALTCIFPQWRPGFALNVSNSSVYYQLGYAFPGDREPTWENAEHFLIPTFNTFQDVVHEGLPPHSLFAAIRLRSGAAGQPAIVTVM